MRFSVPIFRLKRQAKQLAREKEMPLHKALDRVAHGEGFQSWSHLAASSSGSRPAGEVLAQLSPGDLVLLGARPGQGKTLLGLELAAEAARKGRQSFFFTLEYTEADVLSRFISLGIDLKTLGSSFFLDTSDNICADHIIERLKQASGGTVAVVDYLQLLDQKRRNPALADQVQALKVFARAAGAIIVLISQIDRSFGGPTDGREAGRLPDISNVRLPNPLDLTVFTKTCFLHEGDLVLEAVA
tara:strand:+ start:202 stop:930 length:729 start_codon:yes stop_codon:yes gene_type:complete